METKDEKSSRTIKNEPRAGKQESVSIEITPVLPGFEDGPVDYDPREDGLYYIKAGSTVNVCHPPRGGGGCVIRGVNTNF